MFVRMCLSMYVYTHAHIRTYMYIYTHNYTINTCSIIING